MGLKTYIGSLGGAVVCLAIGLALPAICLCCVAFYIFVRSHTWQNGDGDFPKPLHH